MYRCLDALDGYVSRRLWWQQRAASSLLAVGTLRSMHACRNAQAEDSCVWSTTGTKAMTRWLRHGSLWSAVSVLVSLMQCMHTYYSRCIHITPASVSC